jgi:hypothetical protein
MLGFDFVTPRFRLADILRWHVPLPKYAALRSHPVGLRAGGEHLIKAACPPNHPSMEEAVESVVRAKFGPGGIYTDEKTFARIYKGDYGRRYLAEAGGYDQRVIDCVRDICTYIHATHGRFPAHADAIHVPGIWLQTHHVESEYYERFFVNGTTDAHARHAAQWHL